jgi:hypothetical protein
MLQIDWLKIFELDCHLKIKTRVQILKNNIKNSFYKGIDALAPYKTPLRVVFYTWDLRQINPYKTRSLIY